MEQVTARSNSRILVSRCAAIIMQHMRIDSYSVAWREPIQLHWRTKRRLPAADWRQLAHSSVLQLQADVEGEFDQVT